MKKILSVIMLGVAMFTFAQDKVINYNQLPQNSQQFVNKYFGAKQVGSVLLDDDFFSKEYKVYLANGTKVEFDGNRNTIPTGFVPAKITNYVKRSFPNTKIIKIEKDNNSIEAKLNNGLEVKFDRNGNFVKIDD